MTRFSMPLAALGLMTIAMASSQALAGDPAGMWLSRSFGTTATR